MANTEAGWDVAHYLSLCKTGALRDAGCHKVCLSTAWWQRQRLQQARKAQQLEDCLLQHCNHSSIRSLVSAAIPIPAWPYSPLLLHLRIEEGGAGMDRRLRDL